jgi:hypothetical protein
MLIRLLALAATVLACATAWAQAPTPAELDRALAGRWQGHLEYRDYQSDRRFRIPVQTEVRVGSDGATLTRESRFDDGPARGTVLITTVGLYDEAGGQVTTASFRRGRAVETITEQARVVEHTGPTQWAATWQRRGLDGGKDSDIRITVTRRGSELRSVKEVRSAGSEAEAWAFRNETVLTRLP